MRLRSSSALLAALVLSSAPLAASALTLPVIGGPGVDQGQVCPSASSCPGSPLVSLDAPAALTGTITYNSGPSTVDVLLTLAVPASFGGGTVSLGAGSTLSATGIPVISLPAGGGAYQIVQTGAASGSVTGTVGSTLPITITPVALTPAISGLTCIVGTGADQCGLSIGPGGFTFNVTGLGPSLDGNYDVFMTANVNVPEPGTALLLASGTAALAFAARRRSA